MTGIFFALILGVALSEKFSNLYLIFMTPFLLASVLFLTYERDFKSQYKIFALMIIFSILCSMRVYAVLNEPPKNSKIFKSETGIITQVRQWGKFYVAILKTRSGNYLLNIPFANYVEGMRIKFDGVTRNFKAVNNQNSFDEFKYWRARGVEAKISISNVENLEAKFNLYRLRYLISRWLSINTPNLTGLYLKAALLGERDRDLNSKHSRWGTSHLLAVSGFHVGIVILCASVFIKNNFLLSLILWSYVLLTGAAASTLRAALMLQTGIIAKNLGRPMQNINSVSVAGVLLILNSPYIFWDVGYRLSVIAALTITAIKERADFWKISILVFLTTCAEVTSVFKTVPFAGVIINFFAPLYFAIAFLLASLGALMFYLKIPLAIMLLNSVENLFKLYERISDFIVKIFPLQIHHHEIFEILSIFLLINLILNKLEFSRRREFFITILILPAIYFLLK